MKPFQTFCFILFVLGIFLFFGCSDNVGGEGQITAADNILPSQPLSLSGLAVSHSQINLTWQASTDDVGVAGYKVYRDGSEITTTSTISYSDTGLSASTEYSYTVSAFDAADNESHQSDPASAVTLSNSEEDVTSPSQPQNLSAVALNQSQINLTWQASTDDVGVAGYKVYREGLEIGTTTGISYSDTGLSASTEYSYTVSAFDAADNESHQSDPASAVTLSNGEEDVTSPSQPQNLSAVASSHSQIDLTWDASTDNVGVAGYIVYREGLEIGTTTGISYSDTGLSYSREYSYTVSAFDAADNESHQSDLASAVTLNFVDLNVSHYVRAGATGNNDGTDWTNAWTDFPQNRDFIRGHIYYIADGDYPYYHFSAQQDGEKYIYIRKATESDHGTDTGWNSSYGDGQAKFNDRWEISKSYYIFDGKTGGGPGSRETERGIQVNADDTPYVEGQHMRLVAMHGYPAWNREMPSNIEFRRIDFRHQGIDRLGSHRIINNHADVADPVNDGYRNISIRYCSLYDASTMLISSVYGSGWVAEYNYFARNNSTPEIHGAAWQDHGSNNMVVRYNIFEDTQGTSVIDLKRNLGHSNDNWHIYGNVFFSTNGSHIELGMGIVSDNGGASSTETTSRIYVYNNTVYNLDGYRSGVEFWVPDDGTRYAYNNLFIRNRCKVFFNEVNYDYNYYYDNITLQFDLAEHDQVSGSDPCTDYLNYDFRLSGATDAGITLPELYNKDMYGNIRGADGVWDRGAFEYTE